MNKYDKIYAEFKALRTKQLQLYNRVPTVVDELVDHTVFKEAWAKVEAGRQGKTEVSIRALPLPTGSGKSTTTWAFIAAYAKHDPAFSCSYLVHTAAIAEDVQAGIEMLLGDGSTTLWTNYHDVHANEADARKKLGRVPVRKACKADIPNARVVVLTHRQLRLAALRGQDIGVLTYENAPRSLVVTDEYP
jgi:reverse gyrase